MGFIDYSGKREDRYSDIVEFAKAQQEEETRRIEDLKVEKWIWKTLDDARYVDLDMNSLIKYIIVRYRNLAELWDKLCNGKNNESFFNQDLLWKDFCIALVTKRMESFQLPREKEIVYCSTILDKVFKLRDYTDPKKHYEYMHENHIYKQYFGNCFDLVQEKQFWKLLGVVAQNDPELIIFAEKYEQLSVLIGYYLFMGIRPDNSEWMQRLDVEHLALEKIKTDYGKGRLKEPNYIKMHNPLMENPINRNSKKDGLLLEDVMIEAERKIEEPQRPSRPQINREIFDALLEKKQLPDYVEACRLLRNCELPANMDDLYKELILRIPVLQESIEKFKEVYQPDMYQFYEYYLPEALQLTAIYVEYLAVGIGEKILLENEQEVMDATKKLLLAINGKIDEIYKFASIELKAKAKALESIMSQDGYVDPNFKIR